MCITPTSAPLDWQLATNTNDDSLISVVEDFSPPPSPMPVDFTNESDRDETEGEDDHDTFLKSDCIFVN